MILCNNCDHMRRWDSCGMAGEQCKLNPKPMNNAVKSWLQREDCERKNKNNDCADHVKRRWWRL